ncbi:helix-turn-helix transcriptional regulator [Allonocardiopsis opalescens]|uniref:AraC-like DNA-binding protein n=1 Tax=Allonocardiopsis opalescens TaxID=1144618 RepID=A0A2T0Q0P2_9ACTN|nr:helix-turn-helix transcriptional regulator [Allonocardiopsis opalescens]PRX97358.1 AraC-like DNA-binding protein [Allonocardiopsis opalescens]
MIETVFETDDLPEPERLGRWRARLRDTPFRAEFPDDPSRASGFTAYERDLRLGAVHAGWKSLPPLRLRRTAPPPPEWARVYQVVMPLQGSFHTAWAGRESAVGVGELQIHALEQVDSAVLAAPGGRRSVQMCAVAVPQELLPLPERQLRRLLGRRIPASDGVGGLLAGLATRLVTRGEADNYSPADARRLGSIVLDLVSSVFAHELEAEGALEPEAHTRSLTLRIQAFILRHLREPDLAPAAIAAAHHISLSYLHRLFQAQGTTVSSWIRGRRLERARRDLADPALSGTAVHRIAASWGFAHAAAFSRLFRDAYGMAPSAYRRSALGAAAEAVPGR